MLSMVMSPSEEQEWYRRIAIDLDKIPDLFPTYIVGPSLFITHVTCCSLLACRREHENLSVELRRFEGRLSHGTVTKEDLDDFIKALEPYVSEESEGVTQRIRGAWGNVIALPRARKILSYCSQASEGRMTDKLKMLSDRLDFLKEYHPQLYVDFCLKITEGSFWEDISFDGMRPVVLVMLGRVSPAEIDALGIPDVAVIYVIGHLISVVRGIKPTSKYPTADMLKSLKEMPELVLRGYPLDWLPEIQKGIDALKRVCDTHSPETIAKADAVGNRWTSFPQANNYAWARLIKDFRLEEQDRDDT